MLVGNFEHLVATVDLAFVAVKKPRTKKYSSVTAFVKVGHVCLVDSKPVDFCVKLLPDSATLGH